MTTIDETKFALKVYAVPEHLCEGLEQYLDKGIAPGSFLRAALENDLCKAAIRADAFSLAGLPNLMRFLSNEAPPGSWGTPAAVSYWVASGGLSRIAKKD